MQFELTPKNRGLSDQELLDDVIRVAKELGKETVIQDEYNERGIVHSTTLTRRLGSWFTILKLAGLKKSRSSINIPEDDLFHNLEEIWIRLGKQPSYSDIQKPLSKYSVGTYEKRFGGWRNALEGFVNFVNQDEQPLREIPTKKLRKQVGHKTKRSINWRLRFIVMKRDNFKCAACGRSPAADPSVILHVDHIKPWAKGGETVLENLQTLCSKCNIGKSDLE